MPSCHGEYRGFRFRSLLELSYLKWLETQGFKLGVDVLYETFRIPYQIGRGRTRVYVPDIFIVPLKTLVELKHSLRLKTRMNDAKFQAAEKFCMANGMLFTVITEKDVVPQKLAELAKDELVKWSEATKRKRRFGRVIKEAKKR